MAIQLLTIGQTGLVGVFPSTSYIQTNDPLATVLATGYLNHEVANGAQFMLPGMAFVSTMETPSSAPRVGYFQISHVGANWSLVSPTSPFAGVVTLPTVANSLAIFTDTLGTLSESIPGVNVVVNTSATPATTRALKGLISSTVATQTSGNLVGVRGEVDCVSASGGFLYGVQGKVIPTGTLSGSNWTAGVFGQFDLSAATINAGQTAPVWADYGATGGTFTSASGMRMFAGTNTIASLTLFAMDYRYGKATNLLELDGNAGTYITSAGAGTFSGTQVKIAMSIDGVTYYLKAATVIS